MTDICQQTSFKFFSRCNVSRALLLATTALTVPLLVTAAVAQNLPTGGKVAGGSATISQPSANQLNITQSSPSAVVNWQGFSVGQGSAVNFAQPNSSSAILNRVTGSSQSTIAGQVNANGQVYLVNPNGIAITRSGTVNTGGGFVASTLGISDDDFQAGKRSFSGNGASARVSNAGSINVGRGGYAALIGGTVSNSGSINVPLGKVGLGSGERSTLDFAGDGFLQVAMPTHAGGKGALIKNSGSIRANGGSVVISAATAREAARNAINISGVVQARSIGGRSGSIIIGGGGGGVRITGRLIATSRHHTGGNITVTGRAIKLKGATVDASGKTGGGNINIGGSRQGKAPLRSADTTSVDKNSLIKADAITSGKGGNVVIWSDQLTTFAGTISARGGALSGNGGNAEVSGKAKLDYTGFTNLTASHGATGTLLLDPYNVTISNAVDQNSAGFTARANDSVINVSTLQTALTGANVRVSTGSGGSQTGDITVASPLSYSTNTLTLDAYHSIMVNAPISVGGGAGLTLATNDGGSGGTLTFGTGGSATFSSLASTLKINFAGCTCFADQYTLVGSFATLLTNLSSNPSGRFALAQPVDAAGTTYTTAPISNFSGTLEGLGNSISNLTIQSSAASQVGLFGSFEFGRIENLGLVNPKISGSAGGAVVGSLVGFMYSGGTTLFNDHVTGGTISSVASAGGLVGFASDGQIINSDTNTAVSSSSTAQGDYAGGVVGFNFNASITGSHAAGTVTAASAAGGLAGANATGSITNSYASGAVTAPRAGGLIAQNNAAISYDYATGNVTGSSVAGGLIAINNTSSSAAVDHGYATGTVTTGTTAPAGTVGTASLPGVAGGLIGQNSNGPVTNSYATGNVVGLSNTGATNTTDAQSVNQNAFTSILGGLIGSNQQAAVTNSYATGQVQGATGAVTYIYHYTNNGTPTFVPNTVPAYVSGGLLGTNTGSIDANGNPIDSPVSQSYASGGVTGSTAGGLIGANAAATVSYSYALGSVTGGTYAATPIILGNPENPIAGPTGAAGGLIGYNTGLIGTYTTPLPPNGVLVHNVNLQARVSQVYATGGVSTGTGVSGGNYNGGLIGVNDKFGALSQAYWDEALTKQTAAVGLAANTGTTIANAGSVDLTSVFAVGGASGKDPFLQSSYQQSATPTSNFDFNNQWYSVNDRTRPFLRAENSPIIVNTHQLELVAVNLNGNYTLGADINTTPELTSGMWRTASNPHNPNINGDYGFVTIGTSNFSDHFTGAIDGQGHTISNLTINATTTSNQGLFAYLSSGSKVSNVALTSETVAGLDNVGGLAGQGDGTISNSSTSGTFSVPAGSTATVGGLIGFNKGTITDSFSSGNTQFGGANGGLVGINDTPGSIIRSHASGSVNSSASSAAGGLVGNNYGAITASYALGNVIAGDGSGAGGLVGNNFPSGSIINSYASGTVTVSTVNGGNVGGLVGSNLGGSISLSHATGNVIDNGDGGPWAGGLVGYNGSYFGSAGGSIDRSYAIGSVTVSGNGGSAGPTSGFQPAGGGLVGYNDTSGLITKSYSSGPVSATGTNAESGGLVAYNNGSVSDAYSNSTVTGDPAGYIGGFVGYNDASGSIARVYSTGATSVFLGQTPVNPVGGFAGYNAGSMLASYFDTTTSGTTTPVGTNINPAQTDVTGLATTLMQDSENPYGFYAMASNNIKSSWDFHTVWSPPNYDTHQSSDGLRHYAELYPLSHVASIAIDSQTKVYGDANPALTSTNYGLRTGDSVSYTLTTSVSPTSNASTYPNSITPNNLALVSGDGSAFRSVYLPGTFIVTQRPISVTPTTGQGKTYGTSDPTLTFGVTSGNVVNNDTLAGALSRVSYGTPAGENVGTYTITQGTLTTANNPNYLVTFVSGRTFAITPATLTVAADPKSKTYGTSDPALTYSSSGFVNTTVDGVTISDNAGNTLSGSLTRAGFGTRAGENVGNYAITQGTLTASSNYTITYTGANLGITPATLTVAADPKSKTYGTNDPALTYASSGFVSGTVDGVTISDNAGNTLSGSLTRAGFGTRAGENVGNYAITQGTLTASNYTIAYTGANLGITPATLTVAADPKSKTYGTNDPALTYASSGFVSGTVDGVPISDNAGNTLSGSLTRAGFGTRAGENVGNYAITQGKLTASSNYTIAYTGANLAINPATLTVAADPKSKTYGTNDPALTYASSGFVSGTVDGVTISDNAGNTLSGSLTRAGFGTRAGENVGNYAITQGTLTASSNYTITYTGANLGITPATLTVAADPKSKTYGTNDPALTYASSGFVSGTVDGVPISDNAGNTLSGSLTRAGFGTRAGENVGNYAITQGKLTASSNYTIAYTGANLAINPATLTVAADPKSKTYGTNDPALTYASSGFVSGTVDGVTISDNAGNTLSGSLTRAGFGTRAGENVGNYAITQGTLTASSNYTITYTGANLGITPATLTVAADPKSKTYGTNDPALTYASSGFVSGTVDGVTISDNAGNTLSGSLTRAGFGTRAGENVGNYAITQGTLTASNYTIAYTGANLGITPATLTVAADPKSKTYGTTAALGTTAFTQSGLVTANGDSISGVTLASAGAPASASVAGSPYAITASNATGSGLSNYSITYVSGALTVNPAALTITASNQSKTYGTTATLGTTAFTQTGLVTANGDSISGVTLASAGAPASASVAGSPYAITASNATGSGLSNYTISYVSGALTVNPAALTITASNQSKTYGTTAALGTTAFTQSGLVTANGDSISGVTLTSAGAPASASVAGSPYAITASNATGSGLSNYTISYVSGALTVNPAALTITADPQTRPVNTPNPALTFQVSGNLFNGDTITGGLATTANTASPAGTYLISQGTLTVSSNYNLTYKGSFLTVLPSGTPVPPPFTIDPSLLASSVVRDSFDPIALPDDASTLFNGATIITSLGMGTFYADPRFEDIFVCFGGGSGTARSCFAVKI